MKWIAVFVAAVTLVSVAIAAPHKRNGRQFNPNAEYKLYVKGHTVQRHDGERLITRFRGKTEATSDAAQMVIDPLTLEGRHDDTVALRFDALDYRYHGKVYAGQGSATANLDGEDIELNTRVVMKVRINRFGPFVRGVIVSKDGDKTHLAMAVRGKGKRID